MRGGFTVIISVIRLYGFAVDFDGYEVIRLMGRLIFRLYGFTVFRFDGRLCG